MSCQKTDFSGPTQPPLQMRICIWGSCSTPLSEKHMKPSPYPDRKESSVLTVHQLEVTIEARTPLVLDPYCGSALRGAFFHALWGCFCSNREASTCYDCPLNAACPVSSLVA